jgi:ribosomal protein S18 acetylase RimI-like enzyme
MIPLDRPVWSALSDRQQSVSVGTTRARAFDRDIGPLAASMDDSEATLADLAAIVADRGMLILLQADPSPVPAGCRADMVADAVQMVATDRLHLPDPGEVVALGDADAPEMLALAQLTAPGPFGPRTHGLGQFYGVRIDGRLAAMAGERMSLAGYREVSGVCTHPDFRGRGLAMRLCAKVISQIVVRGERPFLHAYASNTGAISVYEKLGFAIRCPFSVMKLVPDA